MLNISIDEIASTILEHSPPLTRDGRRVALATYRLLAEGDPVEVEQIGTRAGLDGSRVKALLDSWPGVFRDQAQGVVGYWGLTIAELGPHRLHVNGVQLSAWCAWDTLFLPALLRQAADVRSRSPLDGEPIGLCVSPKRVEHAAGEPHRLDGPGARVGGFHPHVLPPGPLLRLDRRGRALDCRARRRLTDAARRRVRACDAGQPSPRRRTLEPLS